MRLLIADDERELTSALKMYFSHHNYVVDYELRRSDDEKISGEEPVGRHAGCRSVW